MILQRFLNNKGLIIVTGGLFSLSVVVIILISVLAKPLSIIDMKGFYEKDVSFFHVFSNNMFLISKMYFLGVITFGVVAIISWIQNTVSVALISNSLVKNNHTWMALKMVPHGVFEFISLALAVTTVLWVWYYILKNLPLIAKRLCNPIEVMKNIALVGGVSYVINTIIIGIAGILEVLVSAIKVSN